MAYGYTKPAAFEQETLTWDAGAPRVAGLPVAKEP